MKVIFSNNELKDVIFIRKPEMTYYPIEKVAKDIEILEGFVWKPKERPKSKEEIIPTLTAKTRTPARRITASKVGKPIASKSEDKKKR
jgi:hypothetical protein